MCLKKTNFGVFFFRSNALWRAGNMGCLICNEKISSMKGSNRKRHFDTGQRVIGDIICQNKMHCPPINVSPSGGGKREGFFFFSKSASENALVF